MKRKPHYKNFYFSENDCLQFGERQKSFQKVLNHGCPCSSSGSKCYSSRRMFISHGPIHPGSNWFNFYIKGCPYLDLTLGQFVYILTSIWVLDTPNTDQNLFFQDFVAIIIKNSWVAWLRQAIQLDPPPQRTIP